jgi:outer membrane protein OmpA-like peptidoglycan-associated protein
MNAGINAPSTVLRKLVLLLLLAVAGHMGARAQVRLGILGGLNSANVLEKNSLPGWDTAVKKYYNSRTGFQLGFIIEIPIGHSGLFFQPAITYITKGRKYDKNNDSLTALATDTIYNKEVLNLSYIEVPLNVTYKFPLSRSHPQNSFFVSAGPYVSFFYSGNITYESLTQSSSDQYSSVSNPVTVGKGQDTYKTLDLGVNAKAGFELGKVFLNGYFSRGLTSFYNAPYPGTFHHQVFGLSAGIWLSSTASPAPEKKKDTDKDGIPDDEDQCPLQPGIAKWHGCPVPDTDHDGIDDEHDSCPTIPGVARYNGCPVPDTDHDGIDDEHDSCRTIPGVARYNGCPIPDRDGDGVNDEEDRCPDSAGPVENHGCPLPKVIQATVKDSVNYIAHNILFTPGSNQLEDTSFSALDALTAILQAHPDWLLTIEGHTDNVGTPAHNLLLSQKRVDAVKDYLVKKGIPEARLTATGLGQEHPIASNKTAGGRAINRRVELRLSLNK